MSANDREREREAALVAAYGRLPKAEPSPAIDAAVLARARAALAVPRRTARWPALLATAATLTLAVGVAWQLREAEDRAEAQRASEAPAAEGVDAVGARATAPAAPPAPVRFEDTAERDDAGPESAPEARSTDATPAPAQATATGAVARKAVAAPAAAARSDDGEARSGASERAESKLREEEFVPPPPPPAAAAANASAVRAKAEDARRQRRAVDPTAGDRPGNAPAETASRDVEAQQARAAPEPEPAVVFDEPLPMAEPAPAPPPPEAILEERLAKPAAPPPPGRTLGAAARTPAQWLAAIEELLAAGERERAIEELRRFRAAHPEVELPRALRDLPR